MGTQPIRMTFRERFAIRLRDTRENFAHMTQEELEKRAKLSPTYVSQCENGRRLPSLENYAAIVKALGTNAEHMIGLK